MKKSCFFFSLFKVIWSYVLQVLQEHPHNKPVNFDKSLCESLGFIMSLISLLFIICCLLWMLFTSVQRRQNGSAGVQEEARVRLVLGFFFFSVVWFLPSVDFIISARKVDSREKKTNKKNSQHFQQLEWIQQNNINQKKPHRNVIPGMKSWSKRAKTKIPSHCYLSI